MVGMCSFDNAKQATTDNNIENLTILLWFIYGSKQNNDMYMGYTAAEAFSAAIKLLWPNNDNHAEIEKSVISRFDKFLSNKTEL